MICPGCEAKVINKNINTSIFIDFIEIVITCKKCNKTYYTQIDSKDFKQSILSLNSEDFLKEVKK